MKKLSLWFIFALIVLLINVSFASPSYLSGAFSSIPKLYNNSFQSFNILQASTSLFSLIKVFRDLV